MNRGPLRRAACGVRRASCGVRRAGVRRGTWGVRRGTWGLRRVAGYSKPRRIARATPTITSLDPRDPCGAHSVRPRHESCAMKDPRQCRLVLTAISRINLRRGRTASAMTRKAAAVLRRGLESHRLDSSRISTRSLTSSPLRASKNRVLLIENEDRFNYSTLRSRTPRRNCPPR